MWEAGERDRVFLELDCSTRGVSSLEPKDAFVRETPFPLGLLPKYGAQLLLLPPLLPLLLLLLLLLLRLLLFSTIIGEEGI